MKEVDEKFFSREIKKAHIICSSEYGYLVSLNNNNPYQKLKFRSPANCQFFFYENEFGIFLKLMQNKETKIIAFQIRGNIEGRDFSAEERELQKVDEW